MDTLRAEWKKFVTAREPWVGLGLTLLLTALDVLWSGGVPTDHRDWHARWLWIELANYQFGMLPILLPIALIAGLARSFCGERRGPWAILRCARRGTAATYGAKTAAALLFAAGTAAVLSGVNLALSTARYPDGIALLFRGDVPADGLGIGAGTTVWARWLTQLGCSVLGAGCLAGLVLLLSALLRRPVTVMALAAVLYGLPACAHYGWLPPAAALRSLAVWSWVGMLSYRWPEDVGTALWAFALHMLAVLAAELALAWLAWRRRDRR